MKRLAILMVAAAVVSGCGTETGVETSGIFGRVLLGPQCPVETEASPCPDTPVQATVRVETLDGDELTTFESGTDGRFRVPLEPGSYRLVADVEAGVRFAKPVDVTVPPGSFVRVDVLLDTGIR